MVACQVPWVFRLSLNNDVSSLASKLHLSLANCLLWWGQPSDRKTYRKCKKSLHLPPRTTADSSATPPCPIMENWRTLYSSDSKEDELCGYHLRCWPSGQLSFRVQWHQQEVRILYFKEPQVAEASGAGMEGFTRCSSLSSLLRADRKAWAEMPTRLTWALQE